ncbi:MAG: hypothetical protein IKO35_04985, partial [Elusimicrobiaceae bacterium]|nr:hypothetical protein [Elusimicrobiaceae bacterium]
GDKGRNSDKNRDGKEYTIFAMGISWVPTEITDRQAFKGYITKDMFASRGKYVPNSQSKQSCTDLYGFDMDSKKATDFVNQVKEAYNKQNPDLPIVFDKEYPTDGEFIDALNIADHVGIKDVPVAAVCELGRDFARMSKDRDVGDRSITGGSGAKSEERVFRNELGAFLAYVHKEAILYPDARISFEGQKYCDWRFQPYNMEDGGCAKGQGPRIGKAYAHNNYNGLKTKNPISRTAFDSSLTAVMKQHPLNALVRGKEEMFSDCGSCKSHNGENVVRKYNSYQGFAGLLHEQNPSDNGNGVACEAFLGSHKNDMMSVKDALKYVQGVCSAGLDYKPNGASAKAFNPNQGPTMKGDSPSDNSGTGDIR